MIFALAQLDNTNPTDLGNWLIIAVAVIVSIGSITQVWRFFVPQPPEWKAHIEAAKREAREGDESLRKDLETKTEQLHGRVSKLRDEIRGDYERSAQAAQFSAKETAAKVEATMKEMLTIHTDAMSAIGRLDGQLEAVVQQGHATQQQLQRHIEKEKDR